MEELYYYFVNDPHARICISWFVSKIDPYYLPIQDKLVFYYLRFCNEMQGTPSASFLESYITTRLTGDIYNFKIKEDKDDDYGYSDPADVDRASKEFAAILEQQIKIFENTEVPEDKTFRLCAYEYMERIKELELIDLLTRGTGAAYDKVLSPTALLDQLNKKTAQVMKDLDSDLLKDLDFMLGNNSSDTDVRMELIVDTGIPSIDNDIGGIYSQQCHTIAGQPGSGKTRFALATYVYRALINGVDVLFDETEMTEASIKNILIAHHILTLWNSMYKIPDSLITMGDISQEQKGFIEGARIDLFESGKYGKLYFRSGIAVEQMEQATLDLLSLNPNIKLWVIDYMGNLGSNPIPTEQERFPRRLDRVQIIQRAYEVVTSVRTKHKCVGVVAINQFNANGIEAALQGRAIKSGDMEGGQVVQRYSSYDIALTYTEEQRLANIRGMQCVKARESKGFSPTRLKVDLSVSVFTEQQRGTKESKGDADR